MTAIGDKKKFEIHEPVTLPAPLVTPEKVDPVQPMETPLEIPMREKENEPVPVG